VIHYSGAFGSVGTRRITADSLGSRGEQMYYLSVLGVVILLSVLGWLWRSRQLWFWRVFTGSLVIALAGSFVGLSLVDTWDKRHPVLVELLRGMAAELVVTFLAVAVIERLFELHNKTIDDKARLQLEFAASRQLSDLRILLARICDLEDAGTQAAWSVNRLDRYASNAEATFVRIGSFRPGYLPDIEAFLEAVSGLKDHLWEFQIWVERNVVPRERQVPWDAVRMSARALSESVVSLSEYVSPPSPRAYLTTLNLTEGAQTGNRVSSGSTP